MLKKLAATGVLGFAVSGAALLAAAPAHADIVTSGVGGVLSGNQIPVTANVPVSACGNSVQALTALGLAGAGCTGGAAVTNPRPYGY
ncbi:chaplin family protein [Actinomadura keratinilytica]|uniref:Chaplin domain-containing protein n=1 Tax=Actinomadura keratinilytica TaxID=547461 RepID=A0ABP7Y8C3_9ACTN